MERKEFYRISSNGEGQVFSRSWVCENPWAIVQIAHGMAEYCSRYDEFAEKLVDIGVNVYANDHLGHGLSKQGHQGTFAMKKGGFDYVLEDMKTLFEYAEEQDGKLPKILLGHSMGSILAELYASSYKDIDGLILSGTVAPNSAVNVAIGIANLHIAVHGHTFVSPMLKKLTDFGKKGDSPMERFAWISSDKDVVKKYVEDDDCGFDFTSSANREMFIGLKKVTSKDWAKNVPMIPILIASGSEDPVGNKGAAPKYYYDQLLNTGHDKVTLKIYENDRHEILNEVNREEVYLDITNWINKEIKEQLL